MLCSPFCAAATTACFNASICSCENLSFIRSWSISSTLSDVLSCFAVLALSRASFLWSIAITSFSISNSVSLAACWTALLKRIISLAFLIRSRALTSTSACRFILPERLHLWETTNCTTESSEWRYTSACFVSSPIWDIAFCTDSAIGAELILFAVIASIHSLTDPAFILYRLLSVLSSSVVLRSVSVHISGNSLPPVWVTSYKYLQVWFLPKTATPWEPRLTYRPSRPHFLYSAIFVAFLSCWNTNTASEYGCLYIFEENLRYSM